MVTLSRDDTDKFFSMRTFTNESKTNGDAIGDYFKSIWSTGLLTAPEFNGLVDFYNNAETEAEKTPSNLQGTDPSGNTFPVSSLPQRPRPIHK